MITAGVDFAAEAARTALAEDEWYDGGACVCRTWATRQRCASRVPSAGADPGTASGAFNLAVRFLIDPGPVYGLGVRRRALPARTPAGGPGRSITGDACGCGPAAVASGLSPPGVSGDFITWRMNSGTSVLPARVAGARCPSADRVEGPVPERVRCDPVDRANSARVAGDAGKGPPGRGRWPQPAGPPD